MSSILHGDRLRERTEKILQFLDLNAPRAVLAHAIMLVFRTGWVSCGQEMDDAFGEWMRAKCRVDSGLCQECDHDVLPQHDRLCEHCDAKLDSMIRELEEDAGEPEST